jgi:hypothetical protein
MSRFSKVAYLLLAGLMIIGAVGCTKKPGVQQGSNSKLEDAQSAAQDAERKLGELRYERMQLEKDLQAKQSGGKSSAPGTDSLQNNAK